MWYDADIDAVMTRTARPADPGRPRAAGRGAGLRPDARRRSRWLSLGLLVNWLAAALLAFTIFFYVVVYTMWLKRSTPQNIVIGGAAGAFPPMIGWAAATGGIGLESILLFLIIFFWTPPHFWALALYRTDEYARAGVPMLPVVAGAAETRRQILIYSLVLAPVGAAPWLLGYAGLAYGAVALLGGALMVALAWQLYRAPAAPTEPRGASGCSPSRSSICSCCSRRCWSSTRSACSSSASRSDACWHEPRDGPASRPNPASCSPRSRSAAAARRSIAIALALGVFVVLIYVVTLVKGPGVLNRPL